MCSRISLGDMLCTVHDAVSANEVWSRASSELTRLVPFQDAVNTVKFSHAELKFVSCFQGSLFFLRSLGWRVPEKTPLPWVETHCVEHARRLLSDRILTHVILHVVWAHKQQPNYCKGMRGTLTTGSSFSQQTYHGTCGLMITVQGYGQRLDQSEFRPISPTNAKRKDTSASRESNPVRNALSRVLLQTFFSVLS